MKPIKIVSYNTYLISNRFNNNRVTHPEQRASKICHDFFLSPSSPLSSSNDRNTCGKGDDKNQKRPDLCFFQEVWGSGIQELTQNIGYSTPPRLSSLFSWSSSPSTSPSISNSNTENYQNNGIAALDRNSFFGTAKEMIHTLYFHWQKTGGLYDFSNPSMACRYRSKHTFTISRSKSNKGVEATLWDVPQWRSDCKSGDRNRTNTQNHKQLLVFNTHLDSWHATNRQEQIREIFDFIEDTLQSIERVVVSPAAEEDDLPSSFYTGDQRENSKYDWSQTGVLVVGDFNIKADSDEYWETLSTLESMSVSSNGDDGWKDFFFLPGETVDEDQHTYALQNSMVEYPQDCGRIDYIFGIRSFTKPARLESTASKIPQKCKTTRIFMPLKAVSRSIRKEPIGSESSDHYALILEVIPAI